MHYCYSTALQNGGEYAANPRITTMQAHGLQTTQTDKDEKVVPVYSPMSFQNMPDFRPCTFLVFSKSLN